MKRLKLVRVTGIAIGLGEMFCKILVRPRLVYCIGPTYLEATSQQ